MHAVTPISKGEKKVRQAWRTPYDVFMGLHMEFAFTVDAAASPENALLARHWNEETDALKQNWTGERVFCNPPWSQIPVFLRKALDHKENALSVFLIPASTDTLWYQQLACWFWKENFRGRVQYVPPPGVKKSSVPAGSMVAIVGPGWFPALLGIRTRCNKSGRVLTFEELQNEGR